MDENFAFVKAFLSQELPEAVMYIPEATYLAWVDLSRCLPDVADLPDFFANKAGVLLEGGDSLFVGNAKGYVRLNLAMPVWSGCAMRSAKSRQSIKNKAKSPIWPAPYRAFSRFYSHVFHTSGQ